MSEAAELRDTIRWIVHSLIWDAPYDSYEARNRRENEDTARLIRLIERERQNPEKEK